MKPGKGRKDRPKGVKSFGRSAGKKIERSAVARPERRDNRRDDRDSDKRFNRSDGSQHLISEKKILSGQIVVRKDMSGAVLPKMQWLVKTQ
jgi:hypothetical protein